MDNCLGFLTVCCHLNTNSQEGHPASVSVYKDKTEKTNAGNGCGENWRNQNFYMSYKMPNILQDVCGLKSSSVSISKSHRVYTEFQIASLLLGFGFFFFFSLGWCTAYCHSSVVFALAVLYAVHRGMKCLISLPIFYLNLLSWRQGMRWSFFFLNQCKKTQAFYSSFK